MHFNILSFPKVIPCIFVKFVKTVHLISDKKPNLSRLVYRLLKSYGKKTFLTAYPYENKEENHSPPAHRPGSGAGGGVCLLALLCPSGAHPLDACHRRLGNLSPAYGTP